MTSTSTSPLLQSTERLQDVLDKQTYQFLDLAPKEAMEVLVDKIKELSKTEIVSKSVQVGDKISSFNMKSTDGRLLKSTALLKNGPIVVTFFRGDWCAYCNHALRALQQAHPLMKEKGATLIAISPQVTGFQTQDMIEHKYDFPIVCDPGNELAKHFKVAFTLHPQVQHVYRDVFGFDLESWNGGGGNPYTLPLPATFVIDVDGTVVYKFVDCNPGRRADPTDILNSIPLPLQRRSWIAGGRRSQRDSRRSGPATTTTSSSSSSPTTSNKSVRSSGGNGSGSRYSFSKFRNLFMGRRSSK